MSYTSASNAQTLPVNVYYTDDGLASSQVWAITEDRHGAVWFGCASGISRFNGFSFKNFRLKEGLPSESVNKLEYDKTSGTLYVLTVKGVAFLEDYDDKFQKTENIGEIADISCLPGVPLIGKNQKLFAIVKEKGIYCLDKNSGKWTYWGGRELNPASILSKQNIILIGNKKGEIAVLQYDGKTKQTAKVCKREIIKIKETGDKYLAITSHELTEYNPNTNKTKQIFETAIEEMLIFDAIKDSKGTYWIATNLGLVKIKNGKQTVYAEKEGIYGRVLSVYESSEGILWIGTNHGVVKLISENMTVFKDIPGYKTGSFICFFWDNPTGTMLIGITQGILKIKNNVITQFKNSYLRKFPIWDIEKDKKGNFYFATEGGGLAILDKNGKLLVYKKENGYLPGNNVTDLILDGNNLYIACKEGFAVKRKNSWEKYTTKNKLPTSYVRCLLKDGKDILLGTLGEGILIFRNGEFLPYVRNCPEELKAVFDMHKEGNTLWAASNYGLIKIKNDKIKLFSSEQGFPKYGLSVIYPVGKYFWIGSDGGAILFDKEKEKVVKILTKDDGLPGNEFTTHNAIAEDSENNIWFGLFGSAVKIANKGLADTKKEKFQPKIVIKKLSYYLQNSRKNIKLQDKKTVQIPYKAREIYVDFEVIWYRNQYSLKISHMLTGVNKSWTRIKDLKNMSIYYTMLPPGTHSLKIKVSSIFDTNNEIIKNILKIKVPSPWWMKTEYQIALLSLFLLFVIAANSFYTNWKTKQLQKEKEMLNALVLERTKQLDETNKELEKKNKMLKELSEHDFLTGLYNRRFLEELIEVYKKIASRKEAVYGCFILLDIDFFKKINDTYGHAAGDTVLKRISELITESIRESDFAVRYGGEEFLIVLTNLEKEGVIENGFKVAEKIRKKVEQSEIKHLGKTIKVTVSGGVSCFDFKKLDRQTLESKLKEADDKLYNAKKSGRNRIET